MDDDSLSIHPSKNPIPMAIMMPVVEITPKPTLFEIRILKVPIAGSNWAHYIITYIFHKEVNSGGFQELR